MKVIKLLLAIVILFIAFVPPTYFLKEMFKPLEVFSYENTNQWRYDKGGVGIAPPKCGYNMFAKYLTNCLDSKKKESTNDLDAVRLDAPISVPESFFSQFLQIPNTRLEQEICFKTKNYFFGHPELPMNAETRIFLSKKPVTQVDEIDEKDSIIITARDTECIKAMSGLTLTAIGYGVVTFFDEEFTEGIEQTGKPDVKLQVGEVTITHSGSKTYLDGIEVQPQVIEENEQGKLFRAKIPINSIDFDVVREILVYSKLSFEQKLILAVAVYSLWLVSVRSLLESGKFFFFLIIRLIKAGSIELVEYSIFLFKKIKKSLKKTMEVLARLKVRK